MKKYKNIIFDLDGTLTDSEEGIINSIKYSLSKFKIVEKDINKLKSFIGPPLKDSFKINYSFDEHEACKAIKFYREYYGDRGIYENRLYPGIGELLYNLKSINKNLHVATAKPGVFSNRILEYFKIKKYFNVIIGSNLDGTMIQKSELIIEVLKRLNSDHKENTIMIGDRGLDIIGAKTNNIDSVAVTYGYGTVEELEETAPHYTVNNVDELSKLLLAD